MPSGGGFGALAGGSFEVPVTIAEITDGTSNTAAFGEWIRGNGSSTTRVSANTMGLGMIVNTFADTVNRTPGRRPRTLRSAGTAIMTLGLSGSLHLEGGLVDRRPVLLQPHLAAEPSVVLV